MNEGTMRRALLAAAKVTLTAGVVGLGGVGCGYQDDPAPVEQRGGSAEGEAAEQAAPSTPAKGQAATPPASPSPPASASAPGPSPTPKAPTPPSPPPSEPPSAACADAPCCEAKVSATLGPDDAFGADPDRTAQILAELGEEGLSCCVLLVSAKGTPRSPNHWACCSVLRASDPGADLGSSLACTPWGPPTPPAFEVLS